LGVESSESRVALAEPVAPEVKVQAGVLFDDSARRWQDEVVFGHAGHAEGYLRSQIPDGLGFRNRDVALLAWLGSRFELPKDHDGEMDGRAGVVDDPSDGGAVDDAMDSLGEMFAFAMGRGIFATRDT